MQEKASATRSSAVRRCDPASLREAMPKATAISTTPITLLSTNGLTRLSGMLSMS
jgi:hypothetical protein